jgi:hypothetical protein
MKNRLSNLSFLLGILSFLMNFSLIFPPPIPSPMIEKIINWNDIVFYSYLVISFFIPCLGIVIGILGYKTSRRKIALGGVLFSFLGLFAFFVYLLIGLMFYFT